MNENYEIDVWQDWFAVGEREYRKLTLSDRPRWPKSVVDEWGNCIFGVARNAGPVAVSGASGWGLGVQLEVFGSHGDQLLAPGTMQLGTDLNRVLCLGWNHDDVLVVVQSNGKLSRFGLDGSAVDSYSLDVTAELYDAVVTERGQAVMRTVDGDLWIVGEQGRSQRAVSLGKDKCPPPKKMKHRQSTLVAYYTKWVEFPRIFASCAGGGLAYSTGTNPEILNMGSPASHLSISTNGLYLAGYLADGHVFVISTGSMQFLLRWKPPAEYCPGGAAPSQLAWCGSYLVGALFGTSLTLISPSGDWSSLTVYPETVLVTECDGLRLMNPIETAFVEPLSAETRRIFSLGSTDGSSILYHSFVDDSTNSGEDDRGDGAIRKLEAVDFLLEENTLVLAAECCVYSARDEWSVDRQKSLLSAASYGFSFADCLVQRRNPTPDDDREFTHRDINVLPRVATTLRVLNAVRRAPKGMLITAREMDELGIDRLVARISNFGNDALAMRLADYCGTSPEHVLTRWAMRIIRTSEETEETVADKCIEKFNSTKKNFSNFRIPYVAAAHAAIRSNKLTIASRLLQMESDPSLRVSLLLEMAQSSAAVADAVRSNDSELIWSVFQTLRETMTVRSIVRELKKGLDPSVAFKAVNAIVALLQRAGRDDECLILLEESDNYREAIKIEMGRIVAINEPGKRAQNYESLAASIRRNPRYQDTCHYEMRALLRAAKVTLTSAELERILSLPRGTLISSSSSDLISVATMTIKSPKRRKEVVTWLQKELGVDEQRFMWVVLNALADEDDFDGLHELSKSRGVPPPIGYGPFVQACLRRKNVDEAATYAKLIKNQFDRARALARCGLGKEAVEIAVKSRNEQFLAEVQTILISSTKQLLA